MATRAELALYAEMRHVLDNRRSRYESERAMLLSAATRIVELEELIALVDTEIAELEVKRNRP